MPSDFEKFQEVQLRIVPSVILPTSEVEVEGVLVLFNCSEILMPPWLFSGEQSIENSRVIDGVGQLEVSYFILIQSDIV